jgi:putative nucleotidyltransferase with HDIG domain
MTELPMDREAALRLLGEHVSQPNLLKHCLASEAIMRKLAARLGEDAELWGMVGLLHDLDFEATKETPARHTLVATHILEERGFSPEFTKAIRSHNEQVEGWQRNEPLHYALTCAESVTGLIVAAALVRPEKEGRLLHVEVQSLKKRMKEKAFARNVDRTAVMQCERLGLSLDEFLGIALDAMRGVCRDIGL